MELFWHGPHSPCCPWRGAGCTRKREMAEHAGTDKVLSASHGPSSLFARALPFYWFDGFQTRSHSLYSPDGPVTHYIDQAGFKRLVDPPASASSTQGLQVCVSMHIHHTGWVCSRTGCVLEWTLACPTSALLLLKLQGCVMEGMA